MNTSVSVSASAPASSLVLRFSFDNARHLALPALFAIFGLIMGSWASRIPALAQAAHVSHAALSMVLLCGGLGAVISFPLSGWLMGNLGARTTVLVAGLALLASLVGIGNAPTVPLLMLAVLSLGISASCFDVGMNSAATEREHRSGKSEMSKLHGICCAGGLGGAMFGSLMAGMHIGPATHFMLLAIPLALLLWLAHELLEGGASVEKVDRKPFTLPRGPLALLGLLGFFGSVSEGSIADWSGVFLKEHFHVTDGLAPLALAAFSVMMLISRMFGDRYKARFGARRLVSFGAMLSASGLFFAAAAPNAMFAIAGFATAGLGLSLLFPFVFSAAGKQGPVALAGVATMAYSGSLIGPPVLGAIAQGAGMQVAMAFIATLSVVIAVVSRKTTMLQ